MADKEKNEDNINSLCKKYFTPELRAGLSKKEERELQLKLIKQMQLLANSEWGNKNYKNLNLPHTILYNSDDKNGKTDIATKIEAIDSAITKCFYSWKKAPLQNENGYASFFKTTFLNEVHKFVDEDTKMFTYVPETVRDNERLLYDECKIRGIADDDFTEQKKIALEKLKFSEAEYEAVRKWRVAKGKNVSLETPVEKDENECKLQDTIEDESIQPPVNQYIEKKTGEVIVKFINTIFHIKKRAEWWKALVTYIFYDLLHVYFDLSDDSLNRYDFIDKTIYELMERPTQKQIANILGKDEGQLSKATDNFLKSCLDYVSWYKNLKDDYELQESMREYLKVIREKGKHKKKGEQ